MIENRSNRKATIITRAVGGLGRDLVINQSFGGELWGDTTSRTYDIFQQIVQSRSVAPANDNARREAPIHLRQAA